MIYHDVGPAESRGVWGTSYHLALVELESHALLASLSLSLSLSLSPSLSFSLLSPVPCPAGVARWYGVLGLGAKVRSRMCLGSGRWILNDSLTRGGLLPAPGGDESPRASITKTILSSRRGGGKMQGRRSVRNGIL